MTESCYLTGLTNSDHDGDLSNRKSTSGYAFFLGSVAISRSSKNQPIVMLSTAKGKYVAATSCTCQAV